MLRPPAFIRPHGKLLPASGFISPDGYASRKGLWLPWALASSRVRVDFSAIPCLHRWSHGAAGSSPASPHLSETASGAAGSLPASSHLCPWGLYPTDAAVMQRVRRIHAASPLHGHACTIPKPPGFCFVFLLVTPRRRPRKPLGTDLSEEALRNGPSGEAARS